MLFTFGRTFKVEICRQLASLDKLISQEVKKNLLLVGPSRTWIAYTIIYTMKLLNFFWKYHNLEIQTILSIANINLRICISLNSNQTIEKECLNFLGKIISVHDIFPVIYSGNGFHFILARLGCSATHIFVTSCIFFPQGKWGSKIRKRSLGRPHPRLLVAQQTPLPFSSKKKFCLWDWGEYGHW